MIPIAGENVDNFFSSVPISENNMRWALYLTGVGLATVQTGDVRPPKAPHVSTKGSEVRKAYLTAAKQKKPGAKKIRKPTDQTRGLPIFGLS
jgi:hypothetical protein